VPLLYDTDLSPEQLADEGAKYLRADDGPSRVNPKTARIYTVPPWIDAPPGYEPFFFSGKINPTPNADGNDHTIFSFTVPPEWDGVINWIANAWNGNGFVPFSGSFIWRILRDGVPFKGLDSIDWQYGTTASTGVLPVDLTGKGIIIRSGQAISMVGQNISLVPAGTQIWGLLAGYFWPLQ
jgi:hypothetical protein